MRRTGGYKQTVTDTSKLNNKKENGVFGHNEDKKRGTQKYKIRQLMALFWPMKQTEKNPKKTNENAMQVVIGLHGREF